MESRQMRLHWEKTVSNEPFDMTEIYAQQRKIEEQMLQSKCRQMEFDGLMAQLQAAMMISNFNLMCLTYAAFNPNLDDAALKRIFGSENAKGDVIG
jgi:hypothetical protein